MIPFRKKYAPGHCRYRFGHEEIRWDVVGCNLRCQFCWSPASRPEESGEPSVGKSPEDVLRDTLGHVHAPSNTFIRFTGGEPTLYWNAILRTLKLFEGDHSISQIPILIQTNGIEIGKGNVVPHVFSSTSKQLYLLELSFKGTSKEEFSILTGKAPDLYACQLNAYEILVDVSQKSENVAVAVVLGVYHSSVVKKESKYVFLNPSSGKILFDDPGLWDERFRQIWQSAKLKWVEGLRMFPKGVWQSLWRRCGPQGSGILKYYPLGYPTNVDDLFPMKPKSYEYARLIVEKSFWPQ